MSSRIYGDTRLAMKIDGEGGMDRVTADQLLSEAAAWGLRRASAGEVVAICSTVSRRPLKARVTEPKSRPPS